MITKTTKTMAKATKIIELLIPPEACPETTGTAAVIAGQEEHNLCMQ